MYDNSKFPYHSTVKFRYLVGSCSLWFPNDPVGQIRSLRQDYGLVKAVFHGTLKGQKPFWILVVVLWWTGDFKKHSIWAFWESFWGLSYSVINVLGSGIKKILLKYYLNTTKFTHLRWAVWVIFVILCSVELLPQPKYRIIASSFEVSSCPFAFDCFLWPFGQGVYYFAFSRISYT